MNLAKGYVNCHAMGVDSLLLDGTPGKRKRVFYARPEHELWRNEIRAVGLGDEQLKEIPHKFSVGLHAHHCEVELVRKFGDVWNVLATKDDLGVHLAAYLYQTPIKNQIGNFVAAPEESHGFRFEMHKIDRAYPMRADEIHTIYIPKGESAAWFVFEGDEDPNYTPLTYTNDYALASFDFSKHYLPMSKERADEIRELVGWKTLKQELKARELRISTRKWRASGAWDLAEKSCKQHLKRMDGSVAAGMKRVGTQRFEKWIGKVEAAIESENPDE